MVEYWEFGGGYVGSRSVDVGEGRKVTALIL